jgi:outer membrane protein assembly factor BamB
MVRITDAAQPELLSGGSANSPATLTLSGAAVWVAGGNSLHGYAMDQRGQVSRGQIAFDGAGSLTAPAVSSNGNIYVGAGNSHLYKVPGFPFPASPTQVLDADGAITARPVVGDDGSVYFGTVNGNLYALNPDGGVRWMHVLPATIQAAPALDPNRLYVVAGNELRVYEPGSGGLLWSLALGENSSLRSTPVIDSARRLLYTTGTWSQFMKARWSTRRKTCSPRQVPAR